MSSKVDSMSKDKVKQVLFKIPDNKSLEHLNESSSDEDDFEDEQTQISFEQMGLDRRLLHAIAELGWQRPTLIQEKSIPLALEGNDILARARTGTGKTGAFSLPIVHKILEKKQFDPELRKIQALILVPSKELCQQTLKHLIDLTRYCRREVSLIDLSQGSLSDKKDLIKSELPDIVISTPRKLIEYLQANVLASIAQTLEWFVIDESDLMFSFGYRDDIINVLNHLSKANRIQSFLMSATLSTNVIELKKLALRSPVILKLEEPDLPESDRLQQFHIEIDNDEERFLLVNALFKLGLILGKSIVFVRDVDRCYQLKLFLEQFGIRTCVLNSELPIASRCHVVEQFNSDIYDIIIASDEKCLYDPSVRRKNKKLIGRKKNNANIESGVARGIDFKFVSNVINFDFPTTIDSYIHRVGRTARGADDQTDGTVLSFVSPEEAPYFRRVVKRFDKGQVGVEQKFKPYQFRMNELEAFRYRALDALRAVTAVAIYEARLREIRREVLASKTLKSFFEQHPKDLKVLKFDRPLQVVKNRAYLADLPEYIVPPTLQTVVKSKRENKRIEYQASLSYEPKRRKRQKHQPNNNSSKRTMKNSTIESKREIRNKKRRKPTKILTRKSNLLAL